MNLCVNAVDAMPEGGTLTLRTRNAGPGVIAIQVEDTGAGMSKEVLEKAMDPFFTTKAQGKGTGLGLALAHATVTAHHGEMELLSQPGQGTRVLVRFPACEPAPVTAPALSSGPQAASARASLQVLLVDDDELMQNTFQTILEVLGHSVALAPCGEDALALLQAGYEPDVVILDMNMPGLGGQGTLPLLRVLRPQVPVLLATGRSDQTALDLVAAHAGVTLMAKPFAMKALQGFLDLLPGPQAKG
jgi:CheY-like chemotaxis protein